jgi:hypothetical protein
MVSLIAAGHLLGASLACGLNVYATVAVLGIGSRLGWIESLPPSIHGLENSVIIAAAALLFVTEMIAAAVPVLEAAWEAVHTIVRPVAALALAWLALESAPLVIQAVGAGGAGGMALATHTAKVGLRLVEAKRRAARIALSALEDTLAIGLVLATLISPEVALGVAGGVLALLALRGPRLWRAAAYGARAITARLRGFFGTRDFRDPREMPAALRALLPPRSIGSATPRAVRATLARGAWRNGWLVIDDGRASFLYRGFMHSRRIPIDGAQSSVRPGFLADSLDLGTSGKPLTLLLLKDGPPGETTLSIIDHVSGA